MQWKVSQYLRQAPAYIYIDVKADMVCTQVSWLLHAPFHNPFHIKASMAIYYQYRISQLCPHQSILLLRIQL